MGERLKLKYRHETFGDNAVEGFFSQLKERIKRLKRFSYNSSFNSVQQLESFMAFYNYWRLS